MKNLWDVAWLWRDGAWHEVSAEGGAAGMVRLLEAMGFVAVRGVRRLGRPEGPPSAERQAAVLAVRDGRMAAAALAVAVTETTPLDMAAKLLAVAAAGGGRGKHTCSNISWCIFQHLGGDPGAYLWVAAS